VAKPPPAAPPHPGSGRLPSIQKQVRRLRVAGVAANLADGLVDVAVDRGQVEPAIEIDIEERAAEAEAVARGLAHAGLHGDIGEYTPGFEGR
jgi:hypothetical protein